MFLLNVKADLILYILLGKKIHSIYYSFDVTLKHLHMVRPLFSSEEYPIWAFREVNFGWTNKAPEAE